MSLSEPPSINEGSLPGIFELPWPWPPHKAIRVLHRKLRDGHITLLIELSGRMRVSIAEHEGTTTEILSCPLTQPQHTASTFCIVWKGKRLELYLNANLVASTDQAIPDQYTFPPPNLSGPMHDFSSENAAARIRRRGTVAGSHPVSGRQRYDSATIFGGLSDIIVQAKDSLAHIERGEAEFASGLSSHVRTLIADNKQPTRGLLQWCAGMVNEPLIIYTAANPRQPLPKEIGNPVDMVRLNASPLPTLLTRNPIDLDVWLTLPAAQLDDKILTNYEVVRDVASTIGTHFDVDQIPLVGALRSSSLSGDIDLLVCFMRRVAALAITLSEGILSKEPSN